MKLHACKTNTSSTRKNDQPSLLILLGGFPGAGKSTIGQRLAERLNIPWIDKDSATCLMTEQILMSMQCNPNDREGRIYTDYVKPLEYATIMRLARDNLSVGQSVLCTAPFTSQFQDAEWITQTTIAANAQNAVVCMIWLTANTDTARNRMIVRDAGRDRWKLGCWTDYLNTLPTAAPRHKRLICVENTTPNAIDHVVSEIVTGIRNLTSMV